LTELGCNIEYLGKTGCPPLRISGRMRNSTVRLDAAKSSQYVSSLLLACPLLDHATVVIVDNPSEVPYIEMTLQWLEQQEIQIERSGYDLFIVAGNQTYHPFKRAIPADWSSAAFPICAAAITNSDVVIKGLDLNDCQGDKAILDYLGSMGADIRFHDNDIKIRGKGPAGLIGRDLDINATPDALPALAAVGCCAGGATRLQNVQIARVKETDRISIMAQELAKMDADIQELDDGLVMNKSQLKGAQVNGHMDHRVVMALSIAGLVAEGRTVIDTAEAVSVTYPNYVESMQQLGARFELSR